MYNDSNDLTKYWYFILLLIYNYKLFTYMIHIEHILYLVIGFYTFYIILCYYRGMATPNDCVGHFGKV